MAHFSAFPLDGWSVLVTRPAGQAENLCRLIRAEGGDPVAVPILDIAAVEDPESAMLLAAGFQFDWLIFVSANAVRYALPLPGWHGQEPAPRIAAIGAATEQALRASGITVDLAPKPQSNSEILLAEPVMRKVNGCNILIVRGEGGRDLLGHTLTQRGAKVRHAELYRRVPCKAPGLVDRWRQGGIHAVTVTSGETLTRLMEVLDLANGDPVLDTPLAAISPRLAGIARRSGWLRVATAAETSDSGLVAALIDLSRDVRTKPPTEAAANAKGDAKHV